MLIRGRGTSRTGIISDGQGGEQLQDRRGIPVPVLNVLLAASPYCIPAHAEPLPVTDGTGLSILRAAWHLVF